ncbi:hypothetical protein FA13DRAFT_1714852 [Coprinellus micaceus]|uniref:Uncharacterized protein n=1 Tax=Coprinellus micaceus TaxID=71717 RepID=A0A4Y7SQU1_COPMI|nr:hypothetical protein FA13DRAFT_1714852 [Coprinellus micaceus]
MIDSEKLRVSGLPNHSSKRTHTPISKRHMDSIWNRAFSVRKGNPSSEEHAAEGELDGVYRDVSAKVSTQQPSKTSGRWEHGDPVYLDSRRRADRRIATTRLIEVYIPLTAKARPRLSLQDTNERAAVTTCEERVVPRSRKGPQRIGVVDRRGGGTIEYVKLSVNHVGGSHQRYVGETRQLHPGCAEGTSTALPAMTKVFKASVPSVNCKVQCAREGGILTGQVVDVLGNSETRRGAVGQVSSVRFRVMLSHGWTVGCRCCGTIDPESGYEKFTVDRSVGKTPLNPWEDVVASSKVVKRQWPRAECKSRKAHEDSPLREESSEEAERSGIEKKSGGCQGNESPTIEKVGEQRTFPELAPTTTHGATARRHFKPSEHPSKRASEPVERYPGRNNVAVEGKVKTVCGRARSESVLVVAVAEGATPRSRNARNLDRSPYSSTIRVVRIVSTDAARSCPIQKRPLGPPKVTENWVVGVGRLHQQTGEVATTQSDPPLS